MRHGLLLTLTIVTCLSGSTVAKEAKESLFENVAGVLSERYYDESFRKNELPRIVELYRPMAAQATSFEQERDIVQQFLSNIPATHLALISNASRTHMMHELASEASPTFGFELIEYDGKHYAHDVLEDGPAANAGLRRGDRFVTVDGGLVDDSPRLMWRTDDAFLPDPPVRGLGCEDGDVLKLRIERTPGTYVDLQAPCKPYCAWDATKASARIIERDGKRIGLIHFWLIQLQGPDALLKEKLEGEFASCDALVLDLRGRGGSGFMVDRMLDVLDGTSTWRRPVVALINGHSRSAKEVIANEFRKRGLGSLVGERTAGAVIPVTMADVGYDMHLMFPSFTLGQHTNDLEFVGVEPDIQVAEVGPYSAGADPILEAGVTEAVRLTETERWKARRTEEKPVAPDAATDGAGSNRHASAQPRHAHAAPTSTSRKNTEPDPPGYDARALEVLAKMVDALGGEKALRKHKAKTIRGKQNIGGMIDATFETFAAAPNRLLHRMEMPGMGKAEVGYNGSIGWNISPFEGTKPMEGDELADIVIDADFHSDMNYKKNHKSIRYVGLARHAGKECHQLRLTKPSGAIEVLYLDASSGLPSGLETEVKTNMGMMSMVRTVKEYKPYDGEMIPTKYDEDVGGMQKMSTTVTEVSFEPIDATTFDPPVILQQTPG